MTPPTAKTNGQLISMSRHRKQLRCNTRFWCQRWRRARCFFWLSMVKAKQCTKARSCTPLQNHTCKVQASRLKKSPSVQQRKCARATGCNGVAAPEDRPADSVHHDLEFGYLPPAGNSQGPGPCLGSMSQTCSPNGLYKTPSTAKPNGQPFPKHLALCIPASEDIDSVAPPNLKAFNAQRRPHQGKGLKSRLGGLPFLYTNHPRRQFISNTWFSSQRWRRAKCFLSFKAKWRAKPRSRAQLQNHTGKVNGSRPRESASVHERKSVRAAGCDVVATPEDRPAEESSGQGCLSLAVPDPSRHQAISRNEDVGIITKQANGFGMKGTVPSQSQRPVVDVSSEEIAKLIHAFLDGFLRKFGSFIPLRRNIIIRHLNEMLNADLSKRAPFISSEIAKHKDALARRPPPSYRVVYNKHTLTLEDLSTLDHQNWLNDQVMNMYGDLIMESAHHKVHYFNSFFYQQLVTKGYEGVRRWTKKVDLFSKTLLLVPIHLEEIHWCLMTADIASKRIHLYDSQGMMFKGDAQDMLKYLETEAKEKKQTAFQSGWTVLVNKGIPQQKNENDCGVFVLEYCRCLALGKPFDFSQEDMPKVRKRIYGELCNCQLDT